MTISLEPKLIWEDPISKAKVYCADDKPNIQVRTTPCLTISDTWAPFKNAPGPSLPVENLAWWVTDITPYACTFSVRFYVNDTQYVLSTSAPPGLVEDPYTPFENVFWEIVSSLVQAVYYAETKWTFEGIPLTKLSHGQWVRFKQWLSSEERAMLDEECDLGSGCSKKNKYSWQDIKGMDTFAHLWGKINRYDPRVT